MKDLISRARDFATSAHRQIDHRRKYTHQPYESHLNAVARLVAEVSSDIRLVAAAWLHDTVEDTLATHADIEMEFGKEIARLVYELTDVSRPGDGNRAKRKALDREHLAKGCAGAQTVKLADLIDNTSDICRHNEEFGRVYLVEAQQLLNVLNRGDVRLFERAQQIVSLYADKLGVMEIVDDLPEIGGEGHSLLQWVKDKKLARHIRQTFVAEDIAEPLKSFDGTSPVDDVISLMDLQELEHAGIRDGGAVVASVLRSDLEEADKPLSSFGRPINPAQVVNGDCPFSEVGAVLSRYQYCYVSVLNSIAGVISRNDFEKPVVRMWLFGVITVMEMTMTEIIRSLWPDNSWIGLISEKRLQQARILQEERLRRLQHSELLDCLQLGDKGKILLSDPEQVAQFGFTSQKAAKSALKDIESLRNNLAHGQSIVAHDWAQILRFTRNLID